MSAKTNNHPQIIQYFIQSENWLTNEAILNYLADLTDELYINHFLSSISFKSLSKLVLSPSAKSRIDLLLEEVVGRASD